MLTWFPLAVQFWCGDDNAAQRSVQAMSAALLFEAEPMVHPHVLEKLASYLSAKDRLRDAADVQSLIKRLRLPLDFAGRLAPEVRAAYRRVWVKPEA
jgi:hypothetical protein